MTLPLMVSFLFFYGLLLICAFAAIPFVFSALPTVLKAPRQDSTANSQAGDGLPPLFTLAAPAGLAVWLVLFSLLGRMFDDLLFSAVFSLVLLLGASGAWAWQTRSIARGIFRFRFRSFVSFFAFLSLHLLLLWLRLPFSAVEFDPARRGGEKLFNLSMQQSFLRADRFPPEDIWFVGESISYYLLPRSLPGLASQMLERLLEAPLTGGMLFAFSDTFFVALGCLSLSGVMLVLGRLRCHKKGSLAAALGWGATGLVPLLNVPARAISQSLKGTIDLWSLSRIVENTVNEYPWWNFIWGDNHAHSNAIFLQVSCFFWTGVLLLSPRGRSWHSRISSVLLLGFIAAALVYSHSWSVLVAAIVLGFASLVALALRPLRIRKEIMFRLGAAALLALFLGLPHLLQGNIPSVQGYWVPPTIATDFLPFLDMHTTNLFIVILAVIFFALRAKSCARSEGCSSRIFLILRRRCILAAFALSSLALGLVGYGGVAVALLATGTLAHFSASLVTPQRSPLLFILLSALFIMWATPEVVAVNFHMGDAYMRYNSLFRFYFESAYVVPLLLLSIISLAVPSDPPIPLSIIAKVSFSLIIAGFASLALIANVALLELRWSDSQYPKVLDGFAFLSERAPGDWQIISYLARKKERVVLGEFCSPDAGGYSQAGRIAAYSGHKGMCGWVNHSGQYHAIVRNGPWKGTGGYALLLERARNLRVIYTENGSSIINASERQEALAELRKDGLTHLVFGELEKQKYPDASLDQLAHLGRIVFRSGEWGVIEVDLAKHFQH